jgi:hypothetical protein
MSALRLLKDETFADANYTMEMLHQVDLTATGQ